MKTLDDTLKEVIAKTDAKPYNGGFLGHCPCSGHAHGDANPSLTFCVTSGKLLFTCQSQHHSFKEICAALGIEEKDCFSDSSQSFKSQPIQTKGTKDEEKPETLTLAEFAAAKRLKKKTLELYGVQEMRGNYKALPLYFDHSGGGKIQARGRIRYKNKKPQWNYSRSFDANYPKLPYGVWRLNEFQNDYVLLVEGESDSLTLWSAGINALGLPGCGFYRTCSEEYKRAFNCHFLDAFKSVYVSLEDDGGQKMAKSIIEETPELAKRVKVIQWRDNLKDESKPKDPSDVWIALQGDFDKPEDVKKYQDIISGYMKAARPLLEVFQADGNDRTDGKDKTNGKDRRKETSPINGESGGRPSVYYYGVAKMIADDPELGKYRYYKDQWIYYNGHGYDVVSDSDFKSDVISFLHERLLDGTLNEYHVNNVTTSVLHNIITANLEKREFLYIPSRVPMNSFISSWGLEDDGVYYLPLKNCIIDLHEAARQMYEHYNEREKIDVSSFCHPYDMDFLTTHSLPVEFNVNAFANTFMSCVQDCLPDDDARTLLYNMYGLALTPVRKSNVLFCLYGPGGTGKTSIGLNPLKDYVLGENAYFSADWTKLNPKDGRFDIRKFAEYTAAFMDETPEGRNDNYGQCVSTVKRLTCGSAIEAEAKGKDAETKKATALIMITTNKTDFLKNMVTGNDQALLDRARIIVFNVRIRDTKKEVKGIEETFKNEASGILNIALWGLGHVMANGWNVGQSKNGEAEKKRIEEENETLIDRFLSMYQISEGVKTNCEEIYLEYSKLSNKRSRFCINYNTFRSAVIEKFGQQPVKDGVNDIFSICKKSDLSKLADIEDIM